MATQKKKNIRTGFTLVEVLVVVVLLGILAGIVIPQITNARQKAEQTAFVASLKTYATAAKCYMIKAGEYLENASSGVVPTGWADYIDEANWMNLTPIGGLWDVELDTFGIKAAIGVDFAGGSDREDTYMQQIDESFDDGNLATGTFRKITDGRYYFILEDL